MTKTAKNITLKTFKELKNRPSPSRRGTTYVIENVDLPGTKNDGKIYKKYVNGKLVQQIFVKKSQHKKLLQKAVVKAKRTLKNKKGGANNQKIVYIQAQSPHIQGPHPQQDQNQNQIQGITVMDGVKLGFGAEIGSEVAGGLINMVFGNN